MARILFAVCGSGLGHATRAHSVGAGLIARDHEVLFVSSLGGRVYLEEHFPGRVKPIFGMAITYEQGAAKHLRTVLDNSRAAFRQLPETIRTLRGIFSSFQPDMVLTDFEPFSAWVARFRKVPFVTLDNMHLLTHCVVEWAGGHWLDFLNAYVTIRLHCLGAQRHLITSFIEAPVRYQPAVLVPPVLRPLVYEQQVTTGDFLVAYAGACGSIDRVRVALESFSEMPVRAYGFGLTGQIHGVTYKATSARGFLSDLSGCAGVICTAGHTLASECLHLRKPMLLMPIAGQYEQLINAHYIERIGAGRRIEKLDTATLSRFLDELDGYRRGLENRPEARLDRVLDAVEAELM